MHHRRKRKRPPPPGGGRGSDHPCSHRAGRRPHRRPPPRGRRFPQGSRPDARRRFPQARWRWRWRWWSWRCWRWRRSCCCGSANSHRRPSRSFGERRSRRRSDRPCCAPGAAPARPARTAAGRRLARSHGQTDKPPAAVTHLAAQRKRGASQPPLPTDPQAEDAGAVAAGAGGRDTSPLPPRVPGRRSAAIPKTQEAKRRPRWPRPLFQWHRCARPPSSAGNDFAVRAAVARAHDTAPAYPHAASHVPSDTAGEHDTPTPVGLGGRAQ